MSSGYHLQNSFSGQLIEIVMNTHIPQFTRCLRFFQTAFLEFIASQILKMSHAYQ